MTDDTLASAFAIVATTPLVTEERERTYRDFRDTFETPSGQRVLAQICREGGIFVNEGGHSEASAHFLDGKRYMAQWILTLYSSPPPKPEPAVKAVSPLDRK